MEIDPTGGMLELAARIRAAGGRTVVYGARALLSEMTVRALEKLGIGPDCLADGRQDLLELGELNGLPVVGLEELAREYGDADIFICLTREYWTVRDILETKGFKASRLHDVAGLLHGVRIAGDGMFGQSTRQLEQAVLSHKRLVETRRGRLSLPFVNMIVTERCSLNCADCNNLIPHIRDRRDYGAGALLEQMSRLMGGIDSLVVGSVIGGEPFLYPELAGLIRGLRRHDRIERLELVTNGTLIPRAELVDVLARNQVHVVISDYGPLSPVLRELRKIFEAGGVSHDVAAFNDWYDMGNLAKRGRNDADLGITFTNCKFKYCPTLLGGKLYRCSRSAFGTRVGAIPPAAGEGIDLNDPGLDAEAVRRQVGDLFYGRDWLSACDYCDGGNIGGYTIPPAIQA